MKNQPGIYDIELWEAYREKDCRDNFLNLLDKNIEGNS